LIWVKAFRPPANTVSEREYGQRLAYFLSIDAVRAKAPT
jgi:hypothetical protein